MVLPRLLVAVVCNCTCAPLPPPSRCRHTQRKTHRPDVTVRVRLQERGQKEERRKERRGDHSTAHQTRAGLTERNREAWESKKAAPNLPGRLQGDLEKSIGRHRILHVAPVPCRNNNYWCCFIHVRVADAALLCLLLALGSIGARGQRIWRHFLRRASLYDGLQLRGSIAGRRCPLFPID